MRPIFIVLALLLAACTATGSTTTIAPSTVPTTQPSTTTTTAIDTPGTTIPSADPIVPDSEWVREDWSLPEGSISTMAAWGSPGLAVVGYQNAQGDRFGDEAVMFFDGTSWFSFAIEELTVPDSYGFSPTITDLVWFQEAFYASLMGDTTTRPDHPSFLRSVDGMNWSLEYLGGPSAAGLFGAFAATPPSPPYPGEAAITDLAVNGTELVASGWSGTSAEWSESSQSVSVPVLWRTTDGEHWSSFVIPDENWPNEYASLIAAGPAGYLVNIGGPVHQSAYLWSSPDAKQWTYATDSFGDMWWQTIDLAVGRDDMIAITGDAGDFESPPVLWHSGNGWQQMDVPFGIGMSRSQLGTADGDFFYVETSPDGTTVWRSATGIDWVPHFEIDLDIDTSDDYLDQFQIIEGPAVVRHDSGVLHRWTPSTGLTEFGVILVAGDDVLNIRSGPGVDNNKVGELTPDATNFTLTGPSEMVGSSTWVELTSSGTTGWVNSHYLAPLVAADEFAIDRSLNDLLQALADAGTIRGSLEGIIGNKGLTVVHFDPAKHFHEDAFSKPTMYLWGTSGCGPDPECSLDATAAEAVGDSFAGAWNDTDTVVAINEPIDGGNGTTFPAVIPAEFANLNYVAVHDPGDDPQYGGIDWVTWYVFFDYSSGEARIAGLSLDTWAP